MNTYYDDYATGSGSSGSLTLTLDKKAQKHTLDVGPVTATAGTATVKGRLPRSSTFRTVYDQYGAALSINLASPVAQEISGSFTALEITWTGVSGGSSDLYASVAGI